LYTDGTTDGGLFYSPTPADSLPAGFVFNGTNLCYDPALMEDPTTIDIVYSISAGVSGTGSTCVRTDLATVTIVPQSTIDLDLPSGFCVDETVNLNDYLFSDSIAVDMDSEGMWTIDPDNGGLDTLAGTISNFGGTGLFTICYTEIETYVCPDGEVTECIAEDCEVVNIYDISGELIDAYPAATVSIWSNSL